MHTTPRSRVELQEFILFNHNYSNWSCAFNKEKYFLLYNLNVASVKCLYLYTPRNDSMKGWVRRRRRMGGGNWAIKGPALYGGWVKRGGAVLSFVPEFRIWTENHLFDHLF